MASSSFSVADSSAENVTFSLQSLNRSTAIYIDSNSTLQLPCAAEISHDIKAAGAKGTDRHIVKFRKTVKDTETGEVGTGVASLQFSVPRNSGITDTIIQDLNAFVANYIATSGNLNKLLDGITP